MYHADHRVNPRNPPKTIVVKADEQRTFDSAPNIAKIVINQRLGLDAKVHRGHVHYWRYVNGDVRYTFQPG